MTLLEPVENSLASSGRLPRIAIICDYKEEAWTSMDVVADMLLSQLRQSYAEAFEVERVRPSMRFRFSKPRSARGKQDDLLSGEQTKAGTKRFNADRVLNRFWDYPRHIRRRRDEFDLFHVIDHSYGQLLYELPPERTIITCHDLDTFQCLLNPNEEPRSFLFRQMMQRTLGGFRRAARVVCVSNATRDEVLAQGVASPEHTIVVPNSVDSVFSPRADAVGDAECAELIGPARLHLDILHVGSTIPRKRIDVLLRVFAKVRSALPNTRLLRVGGFFTSEQKELADNLQVTEYLVEIPRVDKRVLAAIYRRSAVLLQPSEREGFGLPVVEAMACGTPVVASDVPSLQEVAGGVATFCEVGNVDLWAYAILQRLNEATSNPMRWLQNRRAALTQAAKFSCANYSRQMADIYRAVLANC